MSSLYRLFLNHNINSTPFEFDQDFWIMIFAITFYRVIIKKGLV